MPVRHRVRATRSPWSAPSSAYWTVVANAVLFLVLMALAGIAPAQESAPSIELSHIEATRSEDGLSLSFAVRFELPRAVEEALLKGVPLHFVAEAELMRPRWYWRDKRITRVNRTWRLAYQPLARQYRVSFGGLNQIYDNLHEALASVRRATDWKLAELSELEDGRQDYISFRYKLDTALLPRPMQIGISGQPDWNLRLENTLRFQ